LVAYENVGLEGHVNINNPIILENYMNFVWDVLDATRKIKELVYKKQGMEIFSKIEFRAPFDW
jgi:hypothetical protein